MFESSAWAMDVSLGMFDSKRESRADTGCILNCSRCVFC